MTIGTGMPINAKEQVEWITRLIASNASALVIIHHCDSATLTNDLLDIADEHNFPILVAHFKLKLACLACINIESSKKYPKGKIGSGAQAFSSLGAFA